MKQYMITFQNKKGKRVYLYTSEECFGDAYRAAINHQLWEKDLEIIAIKRCINREKVLLNFKS